MLVNLTANAMPFRKGIAITCDAGTVINDKKVTDHHAVIPTRNLRDADLSGLPAGEKAVLELSAKESNLARLREERRALPQRRRNPGWRGPLPAERYLYCNHCVEP